MINLRTRAEKQRSAMAQNRMLSGFVRRLQYHMQREIARTGRDAARRYDETNGSPSAVASVLDEHGMRVFNLLAKSYEPTIRSMALMVFASAGDIKTAGVDIETKDAEGDIDRLAESYLYDVGLDKSVTIAQTSKRFVNNIIIAGANEGLGIAEIARNIRENVALSARARADTIARTEIHAAAQSSSLRSAEAIGLTLLKEWVPSNDASTRSSHSDMASHPLMPMDKTFDVNGSSMMYPSDPNGAPEESINCRCALVYETVE